MTGADVMQEKSDVPDDASLEYMARMVRQRVQRIAERATWDRVAQELAQRVVSGGTGAGQLMAALLSQIAADTAEVRRMVRCLIQHGCHGPEC